MADKNIESKVSSLIEPIIENIGYSLYDLLYVKEGKDFYLRVVIDKREGIDINDCEKVNDAINDILDEADYIKDQYFLEVSSPGVERVLRKDKHFEAQIGNEIYLKLFKSVNGLKEIQGILEAFDGGVLTLNLDGDLIKIENKDIAVARTVFNW